MNDYHRLGEKMSEEENTNKLAKAGMYIAIVALVIYLGFALLNIVTAIDALSFLGFLNCCTWPFAGLGCLLWWIGAILAVVGLVQASKKGGRKTAIIGIVISVISIIIMVIGWATAFVIDMLNI